MFASFCRRRLFLHIRKTPGRSTNPLQPIPAVLPFARSYSPIAVRPASVSYLISCGLSPAATTVRNLRIRRIRRRDTVKADAVRAFLRQYGFTDADISQTVRSAPRVLEFDPERTLRPKLDFCASLGLTPRNLATAPSILTRSLDKHLVPSAQFIRGIIGSDDDLRRGLSRAPRALTAGVEKNMRPAVDALRRCGLITEAAISKLLVIKMDVLMTPPDRISEIFEELKAIGVRISGSRFGYCFRTMRSVQRGAWRRKLALFQSFGLSEGEVLRAFKKQPTILLCTEESIKEKFRFLLDKLKLGARDIIAQPVILRYSLWKCILPRCAVLSVLMREGKIQRDINLVQALIGDPRVFSARFVLRHADDVPDVLKAYEGWIKFEGFVQ